LSAFVPGSGYRPVIDPSAETATVRVGYMDGAVQSGKRAAAEASGSETS
jgi:monoamine oxidase